MNLCACLTAFACTMLVAGCGGGDGAPAVPATATHRIQLGPVSGAAVRIMPPDRSAVLYQGTTDSGGYFKLDPSVVRTAWEKLSPRPDYVWVLSSGGTDTDPNDDGILEAAEAVPVLGEVRGIVPIAALLNEQNVRVSLLSSAIADVLGDTKDLTDERIVDVAKQLQFPDIDRDGKTTVRDVLFYEMGSGSGLETNLRTYYLNAIHRGDGALRQQYVDAARVDMLPVRVEKTEQNGQLQVKLFKLGSQNFILFGHEAPTPSIPLSARYVEGSAMLLSNGQKLFFRECTPSNICSQVQVVLWDGGPLSSFVAAPGGLIGNVYQDTAYIDGVKKQIQEKNADFLSLTAKVSTAQTTIQTIDENISKLQKSLTELDAEIEKLKGG